MDAEKLLVAASLISLCGGLAIIIWNTATSSVTRIMNKLDTVENKVDEHNASAIQRLSTVETKVDNMDGRVKHIERIVLKQA
jgi:tetrahydromethanopterin S-methyltransferase subunit G